MASIPITSTPSSPANSGFAGALVASTKRMMSKSLLIWSTLNFLFVVLISVSPPLGEIATLLRYIMFNVMLCTAITWWRLDSPVRLNWSIRLLLLLQVWLTVCSYHAHITLGRTNDFETSNYFLVMIVVYYFHASVISHYWPEFRKIVANAVLLVFSLSAFVAVLQFFRVPPALAIANQYNDAYDITAWGGSAAAGVRAVGLVGWPEWLAFQALGAWSIVAARLFERPLKTWEFLLAVMCLLAAFMSQSRIMYVSMAICTVLFLIMLITRDRKRGPVYLGVFIAGLLLLFVAGGQRLGYVLSTNIATDQTLEYRRETGWRQAFNIMSERWFFGVGPDNDLVWEVRGVIPDRWIQGQFLDNGFLLLLSWGGALALVLGVAVVLIALISTFRAIRDPETSLESVKLLFPVFILIMCLFNNMFLNNGFTNVWIDCIIATFAGAAMPNWEERRATLRRAFSVNKRQRYADGAAGEV